MALLTAAAAAAPARRLPAPAAALLALGMTAAAFGAAPAIPPAPPPDAIPVAASGARPGATVEYAVKAAYLYKFGEFVEWPPEAFADAASPASICIVGNDPFGAALDKAVAGQRIANRAIAVRRFQEAEAQSGCTVMYVTGRDASLVARTMDTVRGEHVLTVTDGASGAGPAGIINFAIVRNRVRFEIDDGAAAANGLVISSKLLALASAVKPRG